MDVIENIKTARYYLDNIVKEIEKAPEKTSIIRLISLCKMIDERYKEACNDIDGLMEEPIGTKYRNGMNSEFYIEGLDWHMVSLALDKIENRLR